MSTGVHGAARAILLLSVLLSVSCSSQMAGFTILSTRNVTVPPLDQIDQSVLSKDVAASDGRVWFLFLPLGGSPSVNHVVEECLEKGDGEAMINAELFDTFWTFFLFSYESYSAEGDVVRTPSLAAD